MVRELLYGINTVLSLLGYNSGRRKIHKITVNAGKRNSPRIQEILEKSSRNNIPVRELDPGSFSSILKKDLNTGILQQDEPIVTDQGVIAEVSEYNYSDLGQDITDISNKKSILVILDGVTDVGNFGSILRNCSAFGVNGVILPGKRSVDANPRVSKISSGALEEVRVYRVMNITRTIEKLKKTGFWIYGTTSGEGEKIKDLYDAEYSFPLAVVFGSEEKGMHRLVEESCDFLIGIRMSGRMKSLNVATTSGIVLYMLRKAQKNHGMRSGS